MTGRRSHTTDAVHRGGIEAVRRRPRAGFGVGQRLRPDKANGCFVALGRGRKVEAAFEQLLRYFAPNKTFPELREHMNSDAIHPLPLERNLPRRSEGALKART